jgi:hypothetical protein
MMAHPHHIPPHVDQAPAIGRLESFLDIRLDAEPLLHTDKPYRRFKATVAPEIRDPTLHQIRRNH